MKDQNENQIRRILRRLSVAVGAPATRKACPDEESLANYLSGTLGSETKEILEAHLAQCSSCVDEIAAAFKSEKSPITERVPERLVNRAMNLVAGPRREPGVLDVVVRFANESLELVRTTGEWISPLTVAPVGVRGRSQSSETSILQVEKQMGDFKVGIEVERVEAGLCQVAVNIAGQEGKPANDLRVSLLSGEREQASYLARQGAAIFDRIPPGEYQLAITGSGNSIGVIQLSIKEDGDERERKTD